MIIAFTIAGRDVVTLDNLSKGFREAVLYGDLVVGDTSDSDTVAKILRDYDVGAVMHFAAHTVVPESVANPLKYYGNNTASSRTLLEAAAQCRQPLHHPGIPIPDRAIHWPGP